MGMLRSRARTRARTLYAVMIEAEASGVIDRVDGLRYPLIVFTTAADRDAAGSLTIAFLGGCGWLNGIVRGVKRIASDLARIADPVLREAAATAFAGSYAIIADDEPITN
jgi:hypothetical protein